MESEGSGSRDFSPFKAFTRIESVSTFTSFKTI